MGHSVVVSGLVAKRAELSGEVEHYRQELQRLGEELGHLDAAIRLFDPDYELGTIKARQRGRRTQWFRPGECQRLVLEALRVATEPLPGSALTQALMARKGLEARGEALVPVNKATMTVLRRLRRKEVVRRSLGPDGTWVWELSAR
jgi:hypothetical protein